MFKLSERRKDELFRAGIILMIVLPALVELIMIVASTLWGALTQEVQKDDDHEGT